MKLRYYLMLFFFSVSHCTLLAQKNAIIVKAGSTIKESVADSDLYAYPQFTQGTVFFRNGNHSGAAMNYNRFLDEMQFITAKGDTLSLTNEKNIVFIHISTDTFFYDQGYVKLVSSTGHVKLGIKPVLRIIDKEKIGGYGMASSTTAIDSYKFFDDGRKNYDIVVMQELVLAKGVQYYIGDNDNHFVFANKMNLVKLFPKQEQAVKSYFKGNGVAYNNKEDFEKLVQYLGQQANK